MDAIRRAAMIARDRAAGRTPVLAVAGAQGSGKSTLAAAYAQSVPGAVHLSLDDFYLTKAEREELAHEIHPLFVTRGVPGTHDVNLMGDVIGNLMTASASARTALPKFDKLRDDRLPRAQWGEHIGRPDLIVLEGWCLGAREEWEAALAVPVNELEAKEDRQGLWRRHANQHLAATYQDFFICLDAVLFLEAPNFEIVQTWRRQQEEGLRGRALSAEEDAQLTRFIAHYERLTRHMLAGGRRADVVVKLDAQRRAAIS